MTEKVVLDLFCGLGGFSAAFEDSPEWDVVTVDVEEEFDPDVAADVLELTPEDFADLRDRADVLVVLASPPCKTFSSAAGWLGHFEGTAPKTPEARNAIALVYHALGLIRALDPEFWFMENPRKGNLSKILGPPTGYVTYCQYGTAMQKPTDLWGEHPRSFEYRWCQRGSDCHDANVDEGERATQPLPRDPAERAVVPYDLSAAILDAVESDLANPAPEQPDLGVFG